MMLKIVKRIAKPFETQIKWVARQYINRLTDLEQYDSITRDESNINERPIEYSFSLRRLSKIMPNFVLDVGTGKSSWPHLLYVCGYAVTAIDNVEDYWRGDYWNRHWKVTKDNILSPTLTEKFDVITCLSVLEHIEEFDLAIRNMVNLLKPGGHLILTAPFRYGEYHPNVYDDPRCQYYKHSGLCQMFSHFELDRWASDNRLKLVDSEYHDLFTGELWREGDRLRPPLLSKPDQKHQLACFDFAK